MSERTVELDEPTLFDDQAEAVRQATDRAERAEAELAKLKHAAAHTPKAETSVAEPAAQSVQTNAADAALKNPPSPNTRHAGPSAATPVVDPGHAPRDPEEESPSDGEAELRKDSMMGHLLDSLNEGKDIGHYGRLVFAMVARHFLPHEEVLAWMMKDKDDTEEKATLLLRQVEGKDYSPPRRDKILQYQAQQDFPILPYPDDPDCGNLYRNLKFPTEIYDHIGHYQEARQDSHS